MDRQNLLTPATFSNDELPKTELRDAIAAAESLLLYGGVFDDSVGRAYLALLRALADNAEPGATRSRAADLFRTLVADPDPVLAGAQDAWQRHLVGKILHDDNAFTRAAGARSFEAIPAGIRRAARHDLGLLGGFAAMGGARLGARIRAAVGEAVWTDLDDLGAPGDLPDLAARLLASAGVGWSELGPELAAHYHRHGVGRFAAGDHSARVGAVREHRVLGSEHPPHQPAGQRDGAVHHRQVGPVMI